MKHCKITRKSPLKQVSYTHKSMILSQHVYNCLKNAKQWVKNARTNERYSARYSSKEQCLKPEALILLPANSTEAEVVLWFLEDKSNVNSSFYMEDVATEFQVQGLGIDWAIVAWDIDFRYSEDGCKQYQ